MERETTEAPPDAAEGSYTHALVKHLADVPLEEVEDLRTTSVEVIILWGATVLHVQHLTPPRPFHVGEEHAGDVRCDFFAPSEKLGAARVPIVVVERGWAVSVVIPARASGTIEVTGQPRMTVREAIEQGRARASLELPGASELAMPPGSKACVEIGDLVFQISTGYAGRAVAGQLVVDRPALRWAGVSLAVHLALLAAMALFVPPRGFVDDDEGISAEHQYLLYQGLQAAAEKEMEQDAQQDADLLAESHGVEPQGGSGTWSGGAPARRGVTRSPAPGPDPERRAARRVALSDATPFEMIGLLNSELGGDPGALTALWGRDAWPPYGGNSSYGRWFNDGGDPFGIGGFGPVDHRPPAASIPVVALVRAGATQVSGRLPPEVVQRVVRQNFRRFRRCYEPGLRNDPRLHGRVTVRFVIGRDGAVSNVGNGGTDLPDTAVISCVVRAFHGLSFPPLDAGIAVVTYPLVFTPGTP